MPASPQTRRRHAYPALAAAFSAVAALAATLYRFPPAQFRFYPGCPIHQYTGLLCPGCGATRALAALTHGDVAAAVHFNALIVLLLPVAVLYMALSLKRGDWLKIPTSAIQTLLIATILFTIARNLT